MQLNESYGGLLARFLFMMRNEQQLNKQLNTFLRLISLLCCKIIFYRDSSVVVDRCFTLEMKNRGCKEIPVRPLSYCVPAVSC